jgi:hypothetical protein
MAVGQRGDGTRARMRSLAEIRGVRYPDDMLFRMFVKDQMHRKPGRVLEFGCASGNNLMLFAASRSPCNVCTQALITRRTG